MEGVQARTEQSFWAYVLPLTLVSLFNYLGHIVMALDDDWPVLVGNLKKAWKKWERL